MKKLFLILFLLPLFVQAQVKTSGRAVYNRINVTGATDYVSDMSLSNGTLTVTGVGNAFDSSVSGFWFDYSVQSLSGTSITWNTSNGINGSLTITGNTTITLSNLVAGMTGNLTVTCNASGYTLEFSGTVKISPYLESTSGEITTTGTANAIDVYSWYYDGTQIIINGTKDYE